MAVNGYEAGATVGNVLVMTSNNRGHTPEELVEPALNRIISIGDESHPVIQAQAHAFKARLRVVMLQYAHSVIQSERTTLANKLRDAGYPQLVALLTD